MKTNRRQFLKASAAGALTITLPHARVLGANDDIRVAVIGFRSKGKQHIKMFRQIPGVRVTALCDIDPRILGQETEAFKKRNERVYGATDARNIMDRQDVDAVVIATANHWHALHTIWACQSGKDVYVEKPVCHNIWEGQKMVEAARKYGRVVQGGTQRRSDIAYKEIRSYIQAGHIGKITSMHSIHYRRRESIGKRMPYFPAWFDYDLWCGPSEKVALERENFHYDWHWKWHSGNGDLGNLGIHQVDMCRAIADYRTLPPRAISVGRRYGFNDAGDTPNSQVTLLDYPDAPIIVENRNLPRSNKDNVMDDFHGTRGGHVIRCEGGTYVGSSGGWLYDTTGKKVKQFVGGGSEKHQQNFIDAVRSRSPKALNAEILEGHLSTGCCHLGNMSYRTGQASDLATIEASLKHYPPGWDAVKRLETHVLANGINLKETPLTLGAWLTVDPESGRVTQAENGKMKVANALHRREYRKPFVISDTI